MRQSRTREDTFPEDRFLLRERRLAARWDISQRTLQRWRAEGRGPTFLCIEGAIRYPLDAVERASESLDDSATFASDYQEEIEKRRSRTREKRPDLFHRPPEDVARRIAHALESPRPKARYGVTVTTPLVKAARRALPQSWIDRLLAKRVPQTDAEKR